LKLLWMATVLVAGSCVGLAAGCLAQTIEVTPGRIMTDETAAVRATGVQPNSHLTIRAELVDGGGHPWAAEAEFVADAQGAVDASTQAPVKGAYHTVSAMGLIWSMRPEAKDVHIYEAPHQLGSQIVRFHLLQDGKEIASAQLEQMILREGVQQVHVDGELRGVLFLPGGDGKHPGVLVLGGSEGGTPTRRAAWLASRGYAAFALCYFRCEGRPQELRDIALEYFGEALTWMRQRPEIGDEPLAVMGVSRGGELALQLGSMYPWIKAVVAYVPANVRYPSCCQMPLGASWTWKGQALAWQGPREKLDAAELMRASIQVEHTQGPVLVISGEDDGVWPSANMVDAVAARLRQNHFAHEVVVLKYAHAGHRAGMPEIIPAWHNGVPHPGAVRVTDYGGTPEGNAESTLDAIPKVLEFLEKSLKSGN